MSRLLKSGFPALFGLMVYATVRLLQDTGSGFLFWERPWPVNALEISLSIAVGYAGIGLVNWVCRNTDNRPVAQKSKPVVIGRELGIVIVLNALLINLVLTPMAALTDDGLSWNDFVSINIVPQLYILIYYGVIRSGTYLKGYVQQQVLVEKLTNDHLQTELKFLKAQYHPHFLFNALNTIYFQMDEDVSGAKHSIEILSELLRYQLYDQQHQVSVKQELDYLENYIALQKIRASEKLKVTVQLDEQLMNQQIYSLLFLPLVENAFKYVGGKYIINITAKSTAKGMVFNVMNALPSHAIIPSANSGIGLENLSRRLQLLYPNRHQLTVTKGEHEFTAELQLTY